MVYKLIVFYKTSVWYIVSHARRNLAVTKLACKFGCASAVSFVYTVDVIWLTPPEETPFWASLSDSAKADSANASVNIRAEAVLVC